MSLSRLIPALVLALAPLATQAQAQDTDGVKTFKLDNGRMTYEVFEASVPHADLSTCPPGYSSDDYFCRVTIAQDAANVFIFKYDGDMPIVEVRSYPLDSGFPPLQ